MSAVNLEGVAVGLAQERGYPFHGELGRGAFKSAYLVETPEGACALKLAQFAGAPERLLRESAALKSCSHVCIAKLIEAFPYQHDGVQLWVVREEYLSGGTLEQRLQKGPLSKPEIRQIGLCLADVLGHLHEKRLVHRDIKPANILFREDPNVPVLTDFGVVRMLDQPTLTRAFLGMGPGTPAYAAPEQLNNEKAQIGWRTDQFGLAVVLAECLLGRHPYAAKDGSIHDAIALVAAKGALPQVTVDQLTELGFAPLVQALQAWPVFRYRRPEDFVSALKESGG